MFNILHRLKSTGQVAVGRARDIYHPRLIRRGVEVQKKTG